MIASFKADRPRAITYLGRAVRLNPREPLGAEALGLATAGRRLSVRGLNRAILLQAQRLS